MVKQYIPRKSRRVRVPSSVLETKDYSIVDLSEGGLKLKSDKSFSVGKIFPVELNIADSALQVTCEVVWCNTNSSVFEENFFVGVKFRDYRVSDALALRAYIEKL